MPSRSDPIIIIGAGQAGLQASDTLRKEGWDGGIILIGDEPFTPYQRPPLSKAYLIGEMERERLALKPEDFYRSNDIECLLSTNVTAINSAHKSVELSDGQQITYSKLLITTGSKARVLPFPGFDLDNVYYLRSIADVDKMRSKLVGAESIVIIGGGYIGLEVAAIARKLEKEVTLIEAQSRILSRTSSEMTARYFKTLHESNGVQFAFNSALTGFEKDESKISTQTEQQNYQADLVLVSAGGVANDELAQKASLTCKDGVLVDQYCQTSVGDIYAAGDCARFSLKRYAQSARLESVQNAIDQATIAARNMLGQDVVYDPVPWFWSDQYDKKMQIAGLGQSADTHIVRGDMDAGKFSIAYLQENRLLALDAINNPKDYMMTRKLLAASPVLVDINKLSDPDCKISDCVM